MTAVPARKAGLALFLLAFAQFIIAVDYNIVYVALPDIGKSLHFSTQSLQWVVSAYAVSFGGMLLLGGRAVDRIGARRVYLTGLTLYGVGSVAGGLAPVAGLLIAGRLVQGLGGALLFPAVLALIATSFEEGPARNRAFAVWGMTGSMGLSAGALIGGVLTELASWRWVFLINIPLVLIILIPAPRAIRADGPADFREGFDLPAAILATVGVSAIVLGLAVGPQDGWSHPVPVTSLAVGAVLLAAFFAVEAKTRAPLMPLRLLRNRPLVVAMAVLFVFQTALAGGFYVFTTYVQPVLGYNAIGAGLAFLPLTIASMLGSGKLAPSLLGRLGMRATLSLGMVVNGIGIALTAAAMSSGGSYYALVPGSVIWGVGGGLVFVSVFASAGSGVSPQEQGVAGAMASTSQQVGGAVGLAVLVAIANSTFKGTYTTAPKADVVEGLRMAGLIGAGLLVFGGILALALKKDSPAAVAAAAAASASPESVAGLEPEPSTQ